MSKCIQKSAHVQNTHVRTRVSTRTRIHARTLTFTHTHGIVHNIKRKRRNPLLHQNPKVVPKVRPDHAQPPHGRHDKQAADKEKNKTRELRQLRMGVEQRRYGLTFDGLFEEVIAVDAQRKDDGRESVAAYTFKEVVRA